MEINETLVRQLITTQFPQWKDLPIRAVAVSGWDNRTFHLGDMMLVRMPSAALYAVQVEKEHQWLPRLAHALPLPIPVPVAMGQPGSGYPFKWSIYQWISGETAAAGHIENINGFAKDVAHFLTALQSVDATGGPKPGLHSFYRGGDLRTYDAETHQALHVLKEKIDVIAVTKIWETALVSSWQKAPVWVHGDVSVNNLLVQNGKLSAVIDFGQVTVGDPACDLVIAWTLFTGESRQTFAKAMQLDDATWDRARGWALWKALIIAADLKDKSPEHSAHSWHVLHELLADCAHQN